MQNRKEQENKALINLIQWKQLSQIFVETDPVLKRRRNNDREATYPRRYNTLHQKLKPPKQPETTTVGRATIDPRISGGSNGTRMVWSKNPLHHHLPKLHSGKGLDERVRGGVIERNFFVLIMHLNPFFCSKT